MNKSAYIILSLFLTAIFIHSCNNAVSNDIWKDEIMAIKKLFFILVKGNNDELLKYYLGEK